MRAGAGARAYLRAVTMVDGPVVVAISKRHSEEPMCFGAADYVPGPHDVQVADIEGCAVYLDRRDGMRDEELVLALATTETPRLVLLGAGGADRGADTDEPVWAIPQTFSH
jgi:hypothetical protein